MKRIGVPARAALIALAMLLPAPVLFALHFQDGPPARVTGGFGEDSCVACHSGITVNDPTGRLTLTGFPARYVPGTTYELGLALTRAPLVKAAGFELAVRLAAGNTQAGTLAVAGEDMALLEERGVQFAHHRRAVTARPEADTARWQLTWTAPDNGGDVIVHAAAVAADGDESQLGDQVYTLEVRAERDCACTAP